MIRRTKIVATLGPASDDPATLEALLRAGVDVVRLNLSHGSIDEHLAAARHGARRRRRGRSADRRARRPAGPEDPRRRLPGRRRRPRARQRRALRPGHRAEHGRRSISVDYPTLLDGRRSRATASSSATAASRCASSSVRRRRPYAPRSRAAVAPQGRPGVHLSCERLQMFAPDGAGPRAGRGGRPPPASSTSRCRSSAGPPTSSPCARSSATGPASSPRSRRRRRSVELAAITEVADALMVARGDLGIDCPLEDVPAPAEADHPPLRRASGRRSSRRRRCSRR